MRCGADTGRMTWIRETTRFRTIQHSGADQHRAAKTVALWGLPFDPVTLAEHRGRAKADARVPMVIGAGEGNRTLVCSLGSWKIPLSPRHIASHVLHIFV